MFPGDLGSGDSAWLTSPKSQTVLPKGQEQQGGGRAKAAKTAKTGQGPTSTAQSPGHQQELAFLQPHRGRVASRPRAQEDLAD